MVLLLSWIGVYVCVCTSMDLFDRNGWMIFIPFCVRFWGCVWALC